MAPQLLVSDQEVTEKVQTLHDPRETNNTAVRDDPCVPACSHLPVAAEALMKRVFDPIRLHFIVTNVLSEPSGPRSKLQF